MAEGARPAHASKNLALFTRLYWTDFGSRGIAQFADTLPPDDARWYRFLGERSDVEFSSWERTPFLASYLEAAGRVRIRALSFLAFGYLHVAYDFPRFIADSFGRYPELPRDRCHQTYVRGAQSVWETIVRQSKRASGMGLCGALLRLLPGDRPAARMAAAWFLAHRGVAWTAAEALAASGDRAGLEERLAAGIVHAGRTLLHRSPLRWIRELPFSSDLVAAETTHTTSGSTGG